MLTPGMRRKLLSFLEDDISSGDITSALIGEKGCTAAIRLKEDAVIAGIEEAAFLFAQQGCSVKAKAEDGQKAERNTIVLEIRGKNRSILSAERTALNIMGRMSGVATACAKASAAAKPCRVALTRKTMPGLNGFDRKAALLGGADTHRFDLSGMVLLKSNHLKFFGSVKEAVRTAKEKTSFSKKVEVEVRNHGEAVEAAKAGPDIIMLDNFSAEDAGRAIAGIRKTNPAVLVECSGGITMQNLRDYAKLKPDVISIGALTKSAGAVDYSLSVK